MRKEVKDWIAQAEQDYQAAEYNFKGRLFSYATFLCQQSLEKALKALYIHEKKLKSPKSHSLIFLAKHTTLPKQFYSFLGELTPTFITTRYPDVAGDLPSEIYTSEYTSELMEKSKEVLEWIKKKLSVDS